MQWVFPPLTQPFRTTSPCYEEAHCVLVEQCRKAATTVPHQAVKCPVCPYSETLS